MNDETSPKRGRPLTSGVQTSSKDNLRNTAALAVLQGIITHGANIVNKQEVMAYCFELADAFVEASNE